MTSPADRPDASMTLLNEVMESPLDPGYEEAHRAGPRPVGARRRLVREGLVLALSIALGLGGVTAALQLRAPSASPLSARTLLEEQIKERTEAGDALAEEIATIRGEIDTMQRQAADPAQAGQIERARLDAISAGTLPVTGPGLVITLEDSARPGADEESRVADLDIQTVVNGLWAAGAEAVAVNGRRLSAGTAIRTAGSTILVDLVGLQSPYTIEAIGDPDKLRSNFARTNATPHLANISQRYGISSSVKQSGELTLAAVEAPKLNYATVMGG